MSTIKDWGQTTVAMTLWGLVMDNPNSEIIIKVAPNLEKLDQGWYMTKKPGKIITITIKTG